MNPKKRLIILLLFILPLFAQAQRIVETDSTHRKSAIKLMENLRDGKAVDTLSPRVIVLGNEDCGHCHDMQQFLTADGVAYEMYDVGKDTRFFYLLVDYSNKVTKGNIAISYPAIIANGKIYTKIADLKAFSAGLKAMQAKLSN